MLVALSIQSFVLIERLDLSPVNGFTALTGETGAGKSIILDALSIALGGTADRRVVRQADDRAVVSAAFSVPADHPVWEQIDDAGLAFDRGETLALKRIVPRSGAIRALVNDQPVSAALLRSIGASLVDLHGQHAAMSLLRPQQHRIVLDQYARNDALLGRCREAWIAFCDARDRRATLESEAGAQADERDALARDIEALDNVAVTHGEAAALATRRAILSQGSRIRDGLAEAERALGGGHSRDGLAQAARAVERLVRLPGLDDGANESAIPTFADGLRTLGEGLERALIELDEAENTLSHLQAEAGGDDGDLETTEARLFAIRALARRFQVEPDCLPALRESLATQFAKLEAGDDALIAARSAEVAAKAQWRTVAEALSAARRGAADRLEVAVKGELEPLRMAGVKLRVSMARVDNDESGADGQDKVAFEIETNQRAGFGPLAKIASGGELARIALAIRCALSDAGDAPVLVFDEVDQGVGGAVAAAIGERLAGLGEVRQVFAITHSPQVAAAADAQWQIEKKAHADGSGETVVSRLDDQSRLEEVARMLSGHSVTPEARQAAARLLETSCPRPNP